MGSFDLQSYLDQAYAQFPEGDEKPVIGITGNYEDLTCKLGQGYYKSVVAAGAVPLIIPPVADKDVIINTLERIDGLILSGGGDINPLWAGEEPSPLLHGINKERDLPELLIARLAYNRQIPMLGICRGIQTLAVAFGGKVAQDVSEVRGEGQGVRDVKHSQDADRSEPTHSVSIEKDSTLYNIYKSILSPLTPHHSPLKLPLRLRSLISISATGITLRWALVSSVILLSRPSATVMPYARHFLMDVSPSSVQTTHLICSPRNKVVVRRLRVVCR